MREAIVQDEKEQNMTNSLRISIVVVLGTCAGVVGACDSEPSGPAQRPIDSTEATKTVNQRMETLMGGLGDSTARLDTTGSASLATGSLDTALGGSSRCSADGTSGTGSGTGATATVDDVPQSTTEALDEFLHRLVKEAKEHVFRKDFVEVEDANQVVYKIDPASACGTDSDCLDKLSRNPLRFVVKARTDDNLDVSLLVGEARHNPATAVLGEKSLRIRVNLAEAMDAIRLFLDADDQQDLPERLAGIVEATIEKRAEDHFVISGSVVEKFDLLVGQAKGKPVAVTVAPSNPTTQLTVNAVTNTLGYELNLGAVDVRVAGAAACDDACGDKERNGTFSGHLGGLTGGISLTKDAQDLTISGLGLGADTSYVALNNDRLGTLDLNAKNGRKVTVTFQKTEEGTLVTFDPALDIKLALMLNKLSESMRTDMPDWLADEIFEVMLGGAPKPSVLVPAGGCAVDAPVAHKDQLKVVSGQLKLSSSSLPSPVEVDAGMCLLPVDGADSESNPMSQVKAGVCQ